MHGARASILQPMILQPMVQMAGHSSIMPVVAVEGGYAVRTTREANKRSHDGLRRRDLDVGLLHSMIEIQSVTKTFAKGSSLVQAVEDINLTIQRREFVAVIGPSGCGKSTLLNMIAGLYAPTSGRVLYKGVPVQDVNTNVGYMTQKDNLLPWRSVCENVAFPLELAGVAKSEREDRAMRVIEHVGLSGFERRYSSELSGGMRKRACLARMLLYGAEAMLLDEPFAALDAQLKLVMHDLVQKLAAENDQTVVLVTHDLVEAVTLADTVIVCTRRPARIALRQTIDLPRPRDVLDVRLTERFKELYTIIWDRLRDEFQMEQV
jgi:NitT/TauT family transport system ATP-binding protein